MADKYNRRSLLAQIFLVSLKLGLTSFGGPVAHLGYFHNEYVQKRKWVDERTYSDLVALCQFLPGPASSQVGMGIGIMRGGIIGGLISFAGFTLPSAVALTVFALFINEFHFAGSGWLHGLKIVAVVVVLQAVLGMGKNLASERATASIAVASASAVLLWQTNLTQILVIIIAGIAGLMFLKRNAGPVPVKIAVPIKQKSGLLALGLFLAIFLILPFAGKTGNMIEITLFDSFYRSGALVFGGGHVVLPLLERELVPEGLISEEAFLAGYGAAQAVPGPLFTFASYLGMVIGGWKGAIIATAGIFLPGFLLIMAALPFWGMLRQKGSVQRALAGVNASVVGILLAALYDPIFTSTVRSPADFAFGAVLFGLIHFWKLPPWLIALLGASGGLLLF
ncbi:chromate efflux transporter [Bacillus sp. T33-2]|uniref:chromate efflux transporter n=1 Tax=Bacillus sp. T33-2 TaxID=2054168 RepID=UPI000C782B9C|nr:chromate efflux transporter [Bacillus sp. T33-2]PLR95263.1 ChrA protein [Bacillus sp. T33-2]